MSPPREPRGPARDDERRDFERCLDFVRARAAGEAEGVYGPGSLTWEIMSEPLMLLAAPSAVLLQLAHPAICHGVSRYSSFATDYLGRARRTFTTMYDLVFGPLSTALRATRGLHAMHTRVAGVVDEPGSPWEGRAYRANEQPLLRWVAVTLPVCVNALFERSVRPLSPGERARLYEEQRLGAALVGVLPETMPPDLEAFHAWYEATLDGPDLHVGDTARRLLRVLEGGRTSPALRTLSAAYLSPRLREGYGLPWGPAEERRFDRMTRAFRLAGRLTPHGLRATVAWHEAEARVARARGVPARPLDRAVTALAQRVQLPTGLSGGRARA